MRLTKMSMQSGKRGLRGLVVALVLISATGCGVPGTSTPVPNGRPTSISIPPATAIGWRFVNLAPFGDKAQIRGISAKGSGLDLTIGHQIIRKYGLDTVYQSATYNVKTNTFTTPVHAASTPVGYTGPVRLSFGNAPFDSPTVSVTIEAGSKSLSLPQGISAYQSMLTPESAPPGSYDTAIIGQTGPWLWLAMTGPEKPQFHGLVWGFRSWTRLLAINVRTGTHVLYAIPASTNPMPTFGIPPAFAVDHGTVWIANENWLGRFPANPSPTGAARVLIAEPPRIAAKRQADMLQALTLLRDQAANGLAAYWDNTVMGKHINIPTSNEPGGSFPWIMDPIIFNHGAYPEDIYWAARFPLKPGSPAAAKRDTLMNQIAHMAANPINLAAVVFPSQIRQHVGGKPPAALPGYVIKDGLYLPAAK